MIVPMNHLTIVKSKQIGFSPIKVEEPVLLCYSRNIPAMQGEGRSLDLSMSSCARIKYTENHEPILMVFHIQLLKVPYTRTVRTVL